jgi:pentatricopeptide repeat protein
VVFPRPPPHAIGKHFFTRQAQTQAADFFRQGRFEDASRLLSEMIGQKESGDLWNDWAIVQLSLAERALRRALQLEPSNAEIAANLGVLLLECGKARPVRAVPGASALLSHRPPASSH